MEPPRIVVPGILPFAVGEVPRRVSERLSRVQPPNPSDGPRPDLDPARRDDPVAHVRDLDARRREMLRHDLPPGPPPTFEMTLLELERDLQHLLARLEAAREHARGAEAIEPAVLDPARGPAAPGEPGERGEAVPDAGAKAPSGISDPAGSIPAPRR